MHMFIAGENSVHRVVNVEGWYLFNYRAMCKLSVVPKLVIIVSCHWFPHTLNLVEILCPPSPLPGHSCKKCTTSGPFYHCEPP